jgi:hypothetical protein
MKTQTKTTAGITVPNHNAKPTARPRMRVKTKVKSLAIIASNHNETIVRR